MTDLHPIHSLEASLETARLKAIEDLVSKELASKDPASKDVGISPEALRDLAVIQSALSAVREEIDAHGEKLGWGSRATAIE